MSFQYPMQITIPFVNGNDLVLDNTHTGDSVIIIGYIMDEVMDLNLTSLSFNEFKIGNLGDGWLIFDAEFDKGLKSLEENEETIRLHLTMEFI